MIRVRRLFGSASDREELERFAVGTDAPHPAKLVVFDLRGCPGGDDSYVERWISRRIDGPVELGSQEVRTGQMRAIDEWNHAVQIRRSTGSEPDPSWLRVLKPGEHIRQALDRLAEAPSGVVREPYRLEVAEGRIDFSAAVIVLTDERTGSSGESTAIMLREALGARVIGQRSRGCIDFGNIVTYPLPPAGVAWQVPTHQNHYPGSPVDLVGVDVDLELDTDDLAAPVEHLVAKLDWV